MYESQTFETLLRRMLDRVPDKVDKREGSIIWDTLAPAAMELASAYEELDYTIDQQNPKTADREHLLAMGDTYAMYPFEPTQAIVEAELITDPPTRIVPVGTRFRWAEFNYVVISFEGNSTYRLQCEQAGEDGNKAFGRIQPIYNVNGLKSANITGLLIPGTDIEDTEDFLERFLEHFQEKAFGGNMADYKQKLAGIQGVGGAKIIRHFENQDFWVEVVFIDSRDLKPTEETVAFVQETMHPLLPDYEQPTIENSGDGLAPIGHVVFVHPVEERTINLGLQIEFSRNYTWEQLQDQITQAIEDYLADLRHDWPDIEYTIVRVSGIELAILGVPGVLDVHDTLINGQTNNLQLGEREIPILGEVTNG